MKRIRRSIARIIQVYFVICCVVMVAGAWRVNVMNRQSHRQALKLAQRDKNHWSLQARINEWNAKLPTMAKYEKEA